jgi:hypothetical protein
LALLWRSDQHRRSLLSSTGPSGPGQE